MTNQQLRDIGRWFALDRQVGGTYDERRAQVIDEVTKAGGKGLDAVIAVNEFNSAVKQHLVKARLGGFKRADS